METEQERDYLSGPRPGTVPLDQEPILDLAADESARALKDRTEKSPLKLTANDKFILDLTEKLDLSSLIERGYIQAELEIGAGIVANFSSLNVSQIKAISHDTSKFKQQREVEVSPDGVERVVWVPDGEEIKEYHMQRTLAEGVVSIGDKALPGDLPSKMAFFNRLDSMIFNAVYRKFQQFLTALSYLFPSDNQKEMFESLKKALAPQ
jgi:hypothetical protein